MGKEYDAIDAKLRAWMQRQKMFFVATAPLSGDGLVNCSPKGRDTLRILGPRELAYLDLPGSGVETIAHLQENARIVLMLCAFDGPPKIVRFHGTGQVVLAGTGEFDELVSLFPEPPCEPRSVITIAVNRIADSCGYGVPLYAYQKDRRSIENYIATHDDVERRDYIARENKVSLDGLPGVTADQ
jgi:hypothetical protein